MKNTRTDEHRPSVINPDEYEFVAFDHIKIEHFGDCIYIRDQRRTIADHMKRTGGTWSKHEHGGNCGVCGNANAIYTSLFYHAPSNSYVRVGENCANKLDMSAGDWNAFRRSVHNALEALAGKKKAAALLTVEGLEECWTIYATAREGREEQIISDIVSKLVKYGQLSEKQMTFLRKLLRDIATRAERDAQRRAEEASAAPCPTGRVKITGTVLAVKVVEGDFGNTTKILVRDDSGFKVWGTRPAIRGPLVQESYGTRKTYICVEKGDRLSFFAAVEPSNDNPKFGFYRRPTKAVALEVMPESI